MPITSSFITRWKAHAPLTDVWAQIKDPLSWPQWWPDFESVEEIAPGQPDGTGNTISCTVKSPVGYRLRFCITAEKIIEKKFNIGAGEWRPRRHWHLVAAATPGPYLCGDPLERIHYNYLDEHTGIPAAPDIYLQPHQK